MNWKFWPFPIIRNYKSDESVDTVFRCVLACPDVRVTRCEYPHTAYSEAVCSIGTLRFWSENKLYAYASRGTFTPDKYGDRMIWHDVMPSRWAVRAMAKLAEAQVVRVRREPRSE